MLSVSSLTWRALGLLLNSSERLLLMLLSSWAATKLFREVVVDLVVVVDVVVDVEGNF